MDNEILLLLDSYKIDILREMAEFARLDVTKNGKKLTKQDLLILLETEYFTPARIKASYEKLTRNERNILNRLLLRSGEAFTAGFKREILQAKLAVEADKPKQRMPGYGSEVPYAILGEYIGSPRNKNSNIFEDIIARLTHYGLVFSKSTVYAGTAVKYQYHPSQIIYIPTVVRKQLPEPEPILSELENWQPERVVTTDPGAWLRDLYIYWDFARKNQIPVLKNGLVAKRTLKVIGELLLSPDPLLETAQKEDETGRLYLFRLLLQSLGLLQFNASKSLVAEKNFRQIPSFWQAKPVEQISACLDKWIELSDFSDLAQIKEINAKQYGLQFSRARKALLEVIKVYPAGKWFDGPEILENLLTRNMNFLIPDHNEVERQQHQDYYYSHQASVYFSGTPKLLLKLFENFETEFVNTSLNNYLVAMGLLEQGYAKTVPGAKTPPRMAFRVSAFGQNVFRQNFAATPDEEHTGKVIIQPNFQVMAIGPVPMSILARLDLFADREQADRGAFQYRVSRESVYQAMKLDLPVAEIIAFLEANGHAELPQNVRRSLDEWAGHHERIIFRRGVSLLQAGGADLLNRLLNDPAIGPNLTHPLTEDVALVKNKCEQALVAALTKQEILPAVSAANPESADQSVIISPDGVIRPIHAVPSLHLRGRLASVAAQSPDGVWHLTPASVKRAGGSRSKVERLLTDLRKLHRGELPEALVTQIRTWGGYFGQAKIETLTLLEFTDAEALAELRRHPLLQPYLTPFSAGNRPLAVVATDHLELVIKILADLGLPVKEGIGRQGERS